MIIFFRILLLLSMCVMRPIDSKEVLLTTNKSGTHFTLYSIQYLTQKPVKNISNGGFQHFHTQLEVSSKKSPIFHTHVPGDVYHLLRKNDNLLFLTRSPIELFLRMYGYEQALLLLEILAFKVPYDETVVLQHPVHPERKISIKNALNSIRQVVDSYKSYHLYSFGKKMIFYYEDLLENPHIIMRKILSLIDEDLCRLEEYADNITEIRKNAYIAYVSQWDMDPSYIVYSDGKNPLYYQQKLTLNEIENIKNLIKKVIPVECFPYINRFM